MGLDDGFIVKNIKHKDIPEWVNLPWECNEGEIEIAYFRKHWGIRGEILGLLHCTESNDSHTPVNAEDIIPIVKILMKYLDKEYYENNADSIWEYDDYKGLIKKYIINLMWLKMYMDSHPEVECYFYDSY